MPWSEAEQYLTFLREYGIEPERLRNWPAYDVWMIICARTIEYINESNKQLSEKEQAEFEADILKHSG